MSSNLRKIQEIKRLTNDIKSLHKYLYGNNDGRSAPIFLDQDQDWTTINQIFEQYVGDLEKKIERRDKLRDDLKHAKSSMRNLDIFDRKLPPEVLKHSVGHFVTAPESSHRATAASLMADSRHLRRTGRGRGRGRGHSRGRGRGRTHKRRHRR
jgi:hypothetical protein